MELLLTESVKGVSMKFKHLFSPIKINTMTLKNRTMGVPFVSGLPSQEGAITDETRERYKREAMGGLGALTIEPGIIQPSKSSHNIRISDDSYIPALKELVDLMRKQDPDLKIGIEFVHFPKTARSGWYQKLTDYTQIDIDNMVKYFADGAKRCVAAGLDYIEFHYAHAASPSNFLSLTNERADEYGGSFENRMKVPTMIYNAVRQVVGAKYPLGVRINGEDFTKGGTTLLQSRVTAKRLCELGFDYISVSAGERGEDALHLVPPGYPPDPARGYSGSRMSPPWYYPDGPNVFLAEGIRRYIREAGFEVPIVTAGKIRTPEFAEQILEQGRADIVGIARAILCDPDWATKAKEGREKDIVKCAACNFCLVQDSKLEEVYCSRWPEGITAAAPIPWLPKNARPAALPKVTEVD